METYEENPVITRLKTFMAHTGLTNSQFADTATIPRPTLSQLLHGRNKSISDQLLKKLHDTFPILDISWLLFGSGEMLVNSNIETSARQNSEFTTCNSQKNIDTQGIFNLEPDKTESTKEISNYDNSPLSKQACPEIKAERGLNEPFCPKTEDSIVNKLNSVKDRNDGSVHGKKIKSIIVFYQDSSFEVFSPSECD